MAVQRDLEARRDRKRARVEAQRKRILEAAESVFADHGYEAARMQDIAARADLSMGTVYGVFPGKWEIFKAVHELRVGELIVLSSTAALGRERVLDAVREGSEAYVRYLVAHPSYLRIHLREGYSWASPLHLESGAQALGWEQGIALMTELFGRAIAEGTMVPGRPELRAKLMVASHQIFLADWVERGMTDDADTLVEAMWTHFERSFVRREHWTSKGAS